MKEPKYPATQPLVKRYFAVMPLCSHAVLQSYCFAVMLIYSHAVIPFLNRALSPLHSSLFPPLMIYDLCLQIVPFEAAPCPILVASFSVRFLRHDCFGLLACPTIPSRCIMALRRDPRMIVGGKYVRMSIVFDNLVPGNAICRTQEMEATTHTQPARTTS